MVEIIPPILSSIDLMPQTSKSPHGDTHDTLYPYYKQIRNQLRKYHPESVIFHLIEALHKLHKDPQNWLRYYQPWNILLVIKWMFQEAGDLATYRPMASVDNVNKILNILHEMEGAGSVPSSTSALTLFMRRIAFQQFWWHPIDGSSFVRQEILFSSLQDEHRFNVQFVKKTGVTIPTFLALSFCVFPMVKEKRDWCFRRADLANLEPQLPSQALDNFFKSISRTPNELTEWLNEPDQKTLSIEDQLLLPSPLIQAPLLKTQDSFVTYYPPLLYRCLEESVYRILRTGSPADFMQKFGPMFEIYISKCLDATATQYFNEKYLNSILPAPGKCVDFLIVEDACNILIDAKGIEISRRGRVALHASSIYETLKESALKAISQAMETIQRIRSSDKSGHFGNKDNYLMVVTFDSLYLGSSSELKTIFGDTLVTKLHRDYGSTLPIPLDNVFFLDVGEFENLMECILAKSTRLVQVLEEVKSTDSNAKTRKFAFGQHLADKVRSKLPFLREGLNQVTLRAASFLPKEEREPCVEKIRRQYDAQNL